VIDDRDTSRWRDLGAAAVLPTTFDRSALLEVLETVASTVGRPIGLPADIGDVADPEGVGLVVAVCGPGGTGASTVAIAVAQGLSAGGRSTVLADLARNAEQAVLHDARDVVPGVQELVEAHRNGVPSAADVVGLTFSVVERGYALLLGLRRARYWPSLRPRAFTTAFASLRRAFDVVVCDLTADFEGESDAGSVDVEERNVGARTAAAEAEVVLVVGRPGVKGVHALVRVLADLGVAGVPAGRIVPVIVGAPRSPRAKAEIASALSELSRPALGGGATPSPLFLPTRPVDTALRDGAPLPSPLPDRAAAAVTAVVDRLGPRASAAIEPTPIVPGSLGSFSD
jgi:MinD-like ATPase involved in chromosome partitioning or flagellar assembly